MNSSNKEHVLKMKPPECKPIVLKFHSDGSIEIPVENGVTADYIKKILSSLNVNVDSLDALSVMTDTESIFGQIQCG